jgi:hypothetical protein
MLAFPEFFMGIGGFQPPYLACIFVHGHLSAISVYDTLTKSKRKKSSKTPLFVFPFAPRVL